MEKFAIDNLPRHPVQVLYGGAHLFAPGLFRKMGERALALPQAANAPERVRRKLAEEPVEDYRIDFEDGFGYRPEAEEDNFAERAGLAFRKCVELGELPFRIGLRPKSDLARATRTLDRFLKYAVVPGLPRQFSVTHPKLQRPDEVKRWRIMLESLEAKYSLPGLTLRHELMIEHPIALRSLEEISKAAENRLSGAHFGAYDYLSSIGVPFAAQALDHPFAIAARHQMLQVFAPCGVEVSDGAYNHLPTGSDPAAIAQALAGHQRQILRALHEGIYCGWDLHPGQLLSRYCALYEFFDLHQAEARARYDRFLAAESQALAAGATFDDAATIEGVRVFLARGRACGVLALP
jgi:citrate lyase beta subunit